MNGPGETSPVALYRNVRPATSCSVGMLILACVIFHCADAAAQTAIQAYTDPLAPKLQTDPRSPPRFEKFDRATLAQLAAPVTFTPPASDAGNSGIDSTHIRKQKAQGKLTAAGQ